MSKTNEVVEAMALEQRCPTCQALPFYGCTDADGKLVTGLFHDARALSAIAAEVVGTLKWYGEQARLARLIHSEGDAGRHALAADGGKRAAAALTASEPLLAQARAQAVEDAALETVNLGAINALRFGQQQIDETGEMVGVSRQALDELLDWFDRVTGPAVEAALAQSEGEGKA
jgi:hypothetical protein